MRKSHFEEAVDRDGAIVVADDMLRVLQTTEQIMDGWFAAIG
jgi:hypothetical protein